MSDLERRLRDSLRSVGDSYDPAAAVEARARFLARRRKRAVGLYAGAAVICGAAAAVAFVVFGGGDVARERDDSNVLPVVGPTVDAVVTDTVEVGDAPSGVGSGAGYVWVANSGDDTVSKVDPATNEVVEIYQVPGGPDDVLVSDGLAWASTVSGDVFAIDPTTGETQSFLEAFTPGSHLDMAPAGGDGVWVVEAGGDLSRLHVGEDRIAGRYPPVGSDLRDVASGAEGIWLYDRGAGEVLHLDETGTLIRTTTVGHSESADLRATDGYTWLLLGDTGTLLQIDHSTGDVVTRSRLGGTFGAIAEQDGVLYVMVAEGGENGSIDGRLYRIDANSAEKIGTPVPLADSPYDIEAGPEGIWVTNHSGDTITRVELVARENAPPDPEVPAIAGEILFYFARDGDIYSYDLNGNVAPVIASEAFETSPSVGPDDATIAYQKGRSGSPTARVAVYGFLEDGAAYRIDNGESPAFSRQGRIAWAWLNQSGRRMISVGTPGTDDRVDFDPDPEWALGPPVIENIEWGSEGDTIIFESSYEGTSLYRADVASDVAEPRATVIAPNEEGAVYLSPAVHTDGTVAVVRLCCGTYPEFEFTVAEVGYLDGDQYTKIAGLDDFGFEPSFDLWMEPAGNLAFEADTGWTVAEQRSWLVGNGDRMGLVSETGEFDALNLTGITHAAVVPEALR